MTLDVEITQGSYWKGGQIPYWLYKVAVILPFTALFGIDHMLLRSPITGILKCLSIIPLFGFWYFYDMAQLGEKDLIEKNGIAIPFYGPVGIGAGIFTDGTQKASPDDIPRPWLYVAYVMASLLFIAFPINKLIIGDYWGALVQLAMYITPLVFITAFIAIGWGFYDVYRILFQPRSLFEKGPARVPPAAWGGMLDDYYNRAVLGPFPPENFEQSYLMRFVSAAMGIPISIMNFISGTVNTARVATVGVVGEVAKDATGIVHSASDGVRGTIDTAASSAQNVVKGTAGVVADTVKAAEGVTGLITKLPDTVDKIIKKLGDPKFLLNSIKGPQVRQVPQVPQAIPVAQVVQLGGAVTSPPSSFSMILLFSIALLAFGGYTLHALRKVTRSTLEADDSPPDPATVRRTSSKEDE